MSSSKRKTSATGFAVLGAVCLLGLTFEYSLIMFEQFLYNKLYNKFTITESITHWLIISGLWSILGLVLFYISARVYGYNFIKKNQFPSPRGWVTAILILLASFGAKFRIYGGWKPLIDFFQSGWFQFIFQMIYSIFQALLIVSMVIFTQESFERFVKKSSSSLSSHFPCGGIILAASWGATHILTEHSLTAAVCYIFLSLLTGAAHLAVKKNFYLSYLFTLLILFI